MPFPACLRLSSCGGQGRPTQKDTKDTHEARKVVARVFSHAKGDSNAATPSGKQASTRVTLPFFGERSAFTHLSPTSLATHQPAAIGRDSKDTDGAAQLTDKLA